MSRATFERIPYPLLCALIGIVLGWLPWFIHGPHPAKFSVLYIDGPVAVWGFYSARMLIGTFVGLTSWPQQWFVRGPLCGFFIMLPVTFISLATPRCGFT